MSAKASDRYLFTILFLLTVIWIAPVAGASQAAAAGLPCLECHKSKNSGKVVHPAIEMGCSSCHGTPHKKEKPELSLSAEVPELCFQCHDDSGFRKRSVHTAVAAGMCISCHNPHSSDNAKLVSGIPQELCYVCHDRGAFTKATQHSPVANGECTTCHNPHSSDHASNLEYPPGEICMNCHGEEASENHVLRDLGLGDRHPVSGKPDPSRKGKEISCLSCHNPHSSEHRSLLAHDRAKVENLCLQCHKKKFVRP